MVRRLKPINKLTLAAMTTALTLLTLFASSTLPTVRLACLFLSSVFVYALACEGEYFSAFMSFLASAVLGFFLLPNKNTLLAFIAIVGHYGIFKTYIDSHMKDKVGRIMLKLLYCNFFVGICVFIAIKVLSIDVLALLPLFPVWVLILGGEVAFILFDIIYSVVTRFYEARLRGVIVPKR